MQAHATRSFALVVAAVLAGCGGGGEPPAITVTGPAGPLAGVDVVFHDADGAPAVTVRTDRSVADRPAMTWSAQAGLASADGVAAILGWREGENPTQLWLVLAPTSVGARVQVPALPDELAAWAPTAFAAMDLGAVVFVESDWLTSYAQLRQKAGVDFVFDHQQSLFPPTGDAVVRLTAGGTRL